jgi:crotonobetainyl-CoA hydratase
MTQGCRKPVAGATIVAKCNFADKRRGAPAGRSSVASDHILTTAANGVLTITLNRPDKLNAITPQMHMALEEAFDRFAADDTLHVCIVTGAGERAFCAGSDLTKFDAKVPYPKTGYAGLAQRYTLAKPVIAAVNGLALGGGFELALACDIIVASDRAVFGLPEPKVGLFAIGGGIHRLVRQVGLKQAMAPLLTGQNIAAAEGLRMGFVSEVATADSLLERADALARQIIANAPLAVRLTKALAMWGLDQPSLAVALEGQVRHPLYEVWRGAEDTAEGPKAFAEKRKAEWKGR